ncbi:hypothetical protein AUC69_15305 [Methyloceanibacter superfactus]|uniref:Ankyrin repeat domain-containing protein n=1 Tax=Methyloceanibacter superfactus TaxID=1774969 RepID=A0A1E3VT52_9HYPH|nr:hypothetical protein [Methyloceanibacter superfactus]ODR96136.1 hypothetical protein AUC69_15305 [Methyloceanibacter superfactus]
MKPSLLAAAFRPAAAAAAAALICLPLLSPDARADRKACQALEQGYEQIQRGASPIEVNNVLFSAADQDCEALAVLVLEKGASLEARDRFGPTRWPMPPRPAMPTSSPCSWIAARPSTPAISTVPPPSIRRRNPAG